MTIIAGFDPGITSDNPLGYAVISDDPLKLISCAAVTPSPKLSWELRLPIIADAINEVLNRHVVDAVMYEAPHFQKNAQVLMKLSIVCGMIIKSCADRNIPCFSVQPTQAKRSWTGNARAEKKDMMERVWEVFQVRVVKDAADACGIAWHGFGVWQHEQYRRNQ